MKSVALDSPGGSVADALKIGRLIHDKGFSTIVAPGALCASACPLILAGGKKRVASSKSAIGVHEVFEATSTVDASRPSSTSEVTAGAVAAVQQTTAAISRYLALVGVDPALWLHALDTPPDRLYYFSAQELTDLKLVTNVNE